MQEFFAVTNRGIEAICAQELARLGGVRELKESYRTITFSYHGAPETLLGLRTVDDIFIHLANWQGIGPHRSTLAQLETLALDLDLWQAANGRAGIHPLPEVPTFSVSANFVGRRNYNTGEIKVAIAKSVETITGWRYNEDDRQSEINLRIFIDHESALVGMRLGSRPLHRRSYKSEHLPGSLKPTVASAMLFLAQIRPHHRIVDPCCGAGTILVEAALQGVHSTGGDENDDALLAAQDNADAAGVTIDVQRWDARALPLQPASIDAVVSNLPWGRQVEVDSNLASFYLAACAEIDRVLTEEGRIVLLTSLPHLVQFPHRSLEHEVDISLFGQQPKILVFGTLQSKRS